MGIDPLLATLLPPPSTPHPPHTLPQHTITPSPSHHHSVAPDTQNPWAPRAQYQHYIRLKRIQDDIPIGKARLGHVWGQITPSVWPGNNGEPLGTIGHHCVLSIRCTYIGVKIGLSEVFGAEESIHNTSYYIHTLPSQCVKWSTRFSK